MAVGTRKDEWNQSLIRVDQNFGENQSLPAHEEGLLLLAVLGVLTIDDLVDMTTARRYSAEGKGEEAQEEVMFDRIGHRVVKEIYDLLKMSELSDGLNTISNSNAKERQMILEKTKAAVEFIETIWHNIQDVRFTEMIPSQKSLFTEMVENLTVVAPYFNEDSWLVIAYRKAALFERMVVSYRA